MASHSKDGCFQVFLVASQVNERYNLQDQDNIKHEVVTAV